MGNALVTKVFSSKNKYALISAPVLAPQAEAEQRNSSEEFVDQSLQTLKNFTRTDKDPGAADPKHHTGQLEARPAEEDTLTSTSAEIQCVCQSPGWWESGQHIMSDRWQLST